MTETQTSPDAAFHRPPRAFPPPVPTEQVSLAPPPATIDGHHEGWVSVLFPVVGSLGLFAFALVYKNKLFLYIACAMVVISIVFALAMRWSQKRSGRKSARRQRRRYREYLAEQAARLEQIAELQLASALRRHPDPQRLWTSVVRRENLWERRPGDADFLSVRAGRAPVAHIARPQVDFGHNPLAEHEQALVDEVRDLAELWGTVDDVPVAVALRAAPVLAVVGARARTSASVRSMLMQLATWHAPSDVRLAVAHVGRDEDWDWLKWLPHARRDGGEDWAAPHLAIAPDVASLSALLDEHVAPRLDQLRTLESIATRGADEQIDAPQLVLVVDGLHPADPRTRLPLLREILAHGRALRVALICTVEQPGDEPAETCARLRLPDRGPATLEETGPAGYVQSDVRVDESAPGAAEAVARSLAPVRLQEHGAAGALDARDGLLGLLGLPSIDALDPRAEWSRRPRSLALRATIGVDAAGRRLELDLKQAAEGGMGPHGLIIGATGSGKSELLRTLVTSLALAHPPEELAFVFVDFKGGAAFAELESLPHTAGMITNLQSDLRLVDRMHAALHGEQERRQRMLRDAGNVDDVIAYRRLREHDPSLPALPDLLVVIDEFGELLASRPEYIDLFVAIGRVGRSLGIHLLFSSQRFDEGRLRGLESHLRYRICLRTFSAIESKGVLGTSDAYVLAPEPGLGYLKVDTSVYERFRAALVAEPRSARAVPGARAAVVVTPFGAGAPARPVAAARGESSESGGDDLRRIVARLREAHASGPVHQVWSAPLEAEFALDAVAATPAFWERDLPPAQLRVTVGMVDIPREQRAEPLALDLAGTAGHLAVVGAPQSGKSTLLRTLVLDLARTHTPDELQVLAIDLGGGQLRGLGALPHVGAVAGKADRELVQRVVARARAEIEAREAAFRRLGLDSMADVHARRRAGQEVPCGHLVLVIDGWAALRRDFQDLDFAIEELLGSGLTYGLHVVVSANRWAEMRPSVSDNLGSRLELRLNDPIESEMGRHASAALPAGMPGRGLVRGGLEFQAALPRLDGVASADDLAPAGAAAAAAIAARWDGAPAPPVLVLPRVLERTELAASSAGVALGVEEERLETFGVDLTGPDAHLLVLGDGESGRTNVLRAFVEGLGVGGASPRVIVLDPRRTLGDVAALSYVETHATTSTGAAQAVNALVAVARERAAAEDAGTPVTGAPIYLVVDDYDLLAGPEGNPLAPLTSVLARGRDLGLHVVLARRVAGVTRASFEPFFQQLLELRTPGIVLSGDPAEGPLLDGQRARQLPPGRGLLVRRGRRPVLVQTVLAPPRASSAPDSSPRHLSIAGGTP